MKRIDSFQASSIQNSSVKEAALFVDLHDNAFFSFISRYGRRLLILFGISLFLFPSFYWFNHQSRARKERDYVQIELNFAQLQKNSSEGAKEVFEENLKTLLSILQRHSELHQKYDAPLAQLFLLRGDLPRAEQFISSTIKRTKAEELPDQISYSNTTLSIAKGEEQSALRSALFLKESMVAHRDSPLLSFLNLLRIAFLEQQVGTPSDEMAAWQQLEESTAAIASFSNEEKPVVGYMKDLLGSFAEGKLTLFDYIEQRKSLLE